MPGLSVTEKEHWKNRIARRIDKRIETIAAEEPNLLDRVHREARQRAMESLGLSDLQAEKERLERESAALEKRERQIERELLARVRGVTVQDLEEYYPYRHDSEVEKAILRRQSVHEDDLLAASEPGRRILHLRAEKDNLLDVVWLATSPKQIKALWSKVAELLGDAQTPLERDALAIEPLDE